MRGETPSSDILRWRWPSLRPVTSAEHVVEQNTAMPAAVMMAAERLPQRSDQVAQRLAM
jgi:hypothetical protein